MAQGGGFGGWSLHLGDGKPKYCYNLFGVSHPGRRAGGRRHRQLRMEFAYDGGGLAKGGTISLYVDGAKTGEGRVDATQPMIFSAEARFPSMATDRVIRFCLAAGLLGGVAA